jgi:UDP-glucose 4-epimerase
LINVPLLLRSSIIEKGSHAIGLKPPITRAIIDKYTEDIAVSSQRIRTELGFKPQYDLKTGWKETVEEMRRRGEL